MKKLLCFLIFLSLPALGQNTSTLSGVYKGQYRIVMWGCPGICTADHATKLGEGINDADWVWDFDQNIVNIKGTYLTVGFPYEIQDYGNLSSEHNNAVLSYLGQNLYRLTYGFQIYNPYVGNPRTETTTVFSIQKLENGRLSITTQDAEAGGVLDGIPGTQIHNVFPMTVQPQMDGWAIPAADSLDSNGDGLADQLALKLGLNPEMLDTDQDGVSDLDELGPGGHSAPADSDQDGLIDALEPGESASDNTQLAGLPLLNSIPQMTSQSELYAGSTITLSAANPWRFNSANTDLMAQDIASNLAGSEQDATLGQPGISYPFGRISIKLKRIDSAAPSENVVLQLILPKPLDNPNELVVYLQNDNTNLNSFKLLPQSNWKLLDSQTIELQINKNSQWNLAPMGTEEVRINLAPGFNKLGGIHRSGGVSIFLPLIIILLRSLRLVRISC